MFGLSVTVAGTGLGVGGWVSGILNIPTPMGAPGPLQGRGFSHFLGLRLGIYRAVLFVSPHLWVRVRCYRIHPVCHVPSVAGAVEAFFAGRDLAAGTCRTYRQALGPLVETVGSDRPVTDL